MINGSKKFATSNNLYAYERIEMSHGLNYICLRLMSHLCLLIDWSLNPRPLTPPLKIPRGRKIVC